MEYEGFNTAIVIEFDYISMKTELVVRPAIITIKFEEKSFFNSILGFNPHWDYGQNIEYIRLKISNLSTIDEILSKYDAIDGSVVKGLQELELFSFILNKPAGIKVFCKPETINNEKINKSVLKTKNFYLEQNHNDDDFKEETLSFTQQLIKN